MIITVTLVDVVFDKAKQQIVQQGNQVAEVTFRCTVCELIGFLHHYHGRQMLCFLLQGTTFRKWGPLWRLSPSAGGQQEMHQQWLESCDWSVMGTVSQHWWGWWFNLRFNGDICWGSIINHTVVLKPKYRQITNTGDFQSLNDFWPTVLCSCFSVDIDAMMPIVPRMLTSNRKNHDYWNTKQGF